MNEHWEIKEAAYGTTLTLLHDWDLDVANQFLGFLEEHFDVNHHKNFVFDLDKVEHIDSIVIGIIISISKQIKGNGGSVVLFKPSPSIQKLLSEIGLLSFFNLCYDESELPKLMK